MSIIITIIQLALIVAFIIITIIYRTKPYHALYLYLNDLKTRDKQAYPYFGFWLFSGLGGTGKTIAMVEYAHRMKKQYPKLHVASGIKSLSFADEYITKWEEVITIQNPNGVKYGVLILFDEIQLTLSSENWKNAPDNLLEYISQQRKLYKHVIASSQVFERVNIKLREQTNYVIEVSNIMKRWIFYKAFHTVDYMVNGELKDNGMKKRRRAFRYNFIATDNIRKLYDTYETQVDLNMKKQKSIDVESLMKLLDENI